MYTQLYFCPHHCWTGLQPKHFSFIKQTELSKQKSAHLCCGRIHQIHPGVSLPQHMVTPGRVGENFHPIQSHLNVRAVKAKGTKINH